MRDLIEEANGLLILKTGDGFTKLEIDFISKVGTIEDMQKMVNSLKREEVVGLFIATDDE